ncbi:MAG: uncharacterized protein KVP18_003213 [Porospora cf. gigantea A]|uniref:uncharacterized protein n=1 Tax=Porospora cf. gigantea A TaxID=2853593 RepID=UPI00355A4B41|nr:MAG: hypothetical protein KVP18_003213 [Porospora cf. gigantea A]
MSKALNQRVLSQLQREALAADQHVWGSETKSLLDERFPTGVCCIEVVEPKRRPPLMVVAAGTSVLFYNIRTEELLREYTKMKYPVRDMAFRCDGRLAALVDQGGMCRILETSGYKTLRDYKNRRWSPTSVGFASNSAHIAVGFSDGAVRLYNMTDEEPVFTSEGVHSDAIVEVAPMRDHSASVFAFASRDGTASVWRLDDSGLVLMFKIDVKAPIQSICFTDDNLHVVVAHETNISLWSVEQETEAGKFKVHLQAITQVRAGPAPDLIFTSALDHTAKLIRLPPTSEPRRKKRKTEDDHDAEVVASVKVEGPLAALDVGRNGTTLALGLANGRLLLKQRTDREALLVLNPPPAETDDSARQSKKLHKDVEALLAANLNRRRSRKVDKLMKSFEHRAALDCVLTSDILDKTPLLVALLDELNQRGALQAALGCDDLQRFVMISSSVLDFAHKPDAVGEVFFETLSRLIEVNSSWLSRAKDPNVLVYLTKVKAVINSFIDDRDALRELEGALECTVVRD